jgi:transposase
LPVNFWRKPKAKNKGKNKGQGKLKRGAQKGHKQNLRKPLAPELVDEIVKLELTICPDCGHKLDLEKSETKTFQQIELVEKPFFVTEYRQLMYWCKHCRCWHYRKLPDAVEKAGLFGPNMIALTAYLKGRCHISYRTLKEYFRDVVGIDISTGFLVKQVKKTSAALKSPYDELEEFLKRQSHLYIDASRGSKVLHETLGDDFLGSISSDFYSAYLKYRKETETLFQFCWAHLIREIKFLATLDATKAYGKRLLKHVKAMFATIHRQDELTELGFKRLMNKHKRSIQKTIQRCVPEHNKAINLAKRFEEHGESYFLFIDEPSIAPTNNEAEQNIRTLIMDRIVTQGTRSDRGNEWHERFWTTVATCRKQGRNVMAFLQDAIFSFLHDLAPPSLLPSHCPIK